MLRIFLALWLALTPAFSWAGSLSLLGVGKPPTVVATPPTCNYVTSGFSATGGGTTTFTMSLTPDNPSYLATRRLFFVGVGATASRDLITGSTFNSASLTNIHNYDSAAGGNTNIFVASIVDTSTTTAANLVMVFNTANFALTAVEVYSVDNSLLTSADPEGGGVSSSITTGTSNTLATALSAGSCLLAASSTGDTTNSFSASDSSLTTDDVGFGRVVGHANNLSSTAAFHVTASWGTSGIENLALMGFR